MRMCALSGAQSLKDLASYLGTVMTRLKERHRREEDLEEGEDLDNNEDDVSSPGFTYRIFYTNQILYFIRTLHRTHIDCFLN